MEKGSKVKAILFAILLVVIYFGVQVIIGAIGGIVATLTAGTSDPVAIQEYTMQIMPTITFITMVANIIVFGLWYYIGFVKKSKADGTYESGLKKIANVKTLCFIAFITLAIYSLDILIAGAVKSLAPSFNEIFNNIFDYAMGDSLLGYISVMLIGPITEELAFRGVLLSRSKKSFGFVGCVVINTIVFSLIHANPMQMIYVIPMGIMLTYLAYKFNSIVPSTIAHIINNSAAVILSAALGDKLSTVMAVVMLVVFSGLTLLVTRLNIRNEESVEC